MLELFIQIDTINPIEFFGVNNLRFLFLKKNFPDLKIICRGTQIKVSGQKENVKQFQILVEKLVAYLEKNTSIDSELYQEFVLGTTSAGSSGDKNIILYTHLGRHIQARSDNQKRMVKAIETSDIVFAEGPAGTGKTFTAVALAVRALKNKSIKKIILTRPAVEAGESLGFLPGDLKEKIDPYLRPLYDALESMIEKEKLTYFLSQQIVEIAPLAYMRGRTLDNAYILLDEAQNTTDLQIKMFLTRLGANAKAIITGDTTQVDLPSHQKSGLQKAIRLLKDIPGIAYIALDEKDVVRHPLIKKIIAAYQNQSSYEPNISAT